MCRCRRILGIIAVSRSSSDREPPFRHVARTGAREADSATSSVAREAPVLGADHVRAQYPASAEIGRTPPAETPQSAGNKPSSVPAALSLVPSKLPG